MTLIQTKAVPYLLKSTTPPELPLEILELVCAHLSQTIPRYGVSLVCKKWYQVSSRFIRRAAIWTPTPGLQHTLIQQWTKFNTLELHVSGDSGTASDVSQIMTIQNCLLSFLKEITKPISDSHNDEKASKCHKDDKTNHRNRDNRAASTTPSCLLQSIRHLELRGQFVNFYDLRSQLRYHV
ncbi:hypothetical protein FBU30_003335 [Linnemannia zychae]|nr:hypothetical protein FBU30_003335 [Linnemannia zychae]